ncbi:MAG: flagellar biosynthetic protein FliO [Magnetococcus sp. YQC-3]
MVRSGVVARLLLSLFVLSLTVLLAAELPGVHLFASALAADGKAPPTEGKPLPLDGKATSSDGKPVPADGKAMPPDGKVASSDLIPPGLVGNLPVEASWKVAAYLLGFIVLAVLVVQLGRRFRPQWRGSGPIYIEDGRNLAPGVGVRLIRVGVRYWLIGVTKEHVTLLGELTEEDLLEEDLAEEEVELVSSRGRQARVARGDEPSLVDRGVRR